MCYDIKTSLEAQLKRARRYNDEAAIAEIEKKLTPYTDLPLFHASGFQHPKVFIYTDADPHRPSVATWGLIPHWVKDQVQKKKIWNNTLNARGETIFEKPSFRYAARNKRAILYIEGFYEHHHHGGKTYPFFISRKDGLPMAIAALWSDWQDPETSEWISSFSVVTTEGNPMMAKIHNNPKLIGPRMPLILPDELEEGWLLGIEDELDIKAIQNLMQSYPESELMAHTVSKLRGKDYLGNKAEISEEVVYDELADWE
jgi:putative SOS response-associated peptidase YedK